MSVLQRFACLLLLCLAPVTLWAHADDAAENNPSAAGRADATRVLGSLSFPTSTHSAEAQAAFEQGLLLLHLFEYPFAREQFRLARQLDPDFAMAYWGEAMTHNHPIWGEQDLSAARAVLARLGPTPEARLARTPVAREQGFLAALELLYGSGSKAERDRAYMRAMELLAARYPDDHEVQLFYALSLFGVQAGVRDTATYMLCTAIAQGVFSENPRHPGAAHYLIHGVDDPLHAVLGLRAARALVEMAPDAAHAQHMASHIFLAVGMWDDVVAVNERAVQVRDAMRGEHGLPPRHWGHYNYWLLYGYLQQGRSEQARRILTAARDEAQGRNAAPRDRMDLDADRSAVGSSVQMWARYLIETRDWDGDVAGWSFNSGDAFDPNLTISFVRTLQAAYGGLVARAGQYREQFVALSGELRQEIGRQQEPAPINLLYLDRLTVMDRELQAAIEMARGEMARAVDHARVASDLEGEMPFSFGPPFVDLPAAEFLGELAFSAGDYAMSAEAFETQLERSRLRARSLEGLAEALRRLGRDREAQYQILRLQRARGDAADTPPVP